MNNPERLNTVRAIKTGYRPHRCQFEIHSNMRRFSVLVCHRRFGKTVLAVNTLIDAAIRHPYGDGRFGYLAPYLKQAKEIAWRYVKMYTEMIPGMKYNEAELTATFPNGSRLRLYGADNRDAMRGTYFDGVVLDEVADMRPDTWEEVVRPTLADRKGWALFIGTPKGMNLFSELYYGARDGWKDDDGQLVKHDDWYAAMYRGDETGLIDEEELEAMRATMSENAYRQELLCDFSASSDNVLITIDMASKAARKHYSQQDYSFAAKILGVDVARYGDDRCVIQPRQGLVAFKPKVFSKIDNMEFAAAVHAAIIKFKPDRVFIDAGRGEGVIDRLRQLGHDNIVEVNFGGKPDDPRFANKRSEMWSRMHDWLADGGAIPNDPELKNDMTVPTYSHKNAAGKFLLESKEQIKARGLRSPDLGDSLALTFAYDVPTLPRDPIERAYVLQNRGGNKASFEYDPI